MLKPLILEVFATSNETILSFGWIESRILGLYSTVRELDNRGWDTFDLQRCLRAMVKEGVLAVTPRYHYCVPTPSPAKPDLKQSGIDA